MHQLHRDEPQCQHLHQLHSRTQQHDCIPRCAQVAVPSDRRYHIIGSQALVDSPLLHHALLFACNDDMPEQVGCKTVIPAWRTSV
jgi:hypothetical protein